MKVSWKPAHPFSQWLSRSAFLLLTIGTIGWFELLALSQEFTLSCLLLSALLFSASAILSLITNLRDLNKRPDYKSEDNQL